MRTSYGIDDMKQNESFIHAAESLVDSFGDSMAPGRYLVNIFPILRYIPPWVPGAGFQKIFRRAAELGRKAVVFPYREAKIGLVRIPFVIANESELYSRFEKDEGGTEHSSESGSFLH